MDASPPIAQCTAYLVRESEDSGGRSPISMERVETVVAIEEPLAVVLNGQTVAVLMRLAGMEKELAVGFCITEGLLATVDALLLVRHCGKGLPDPGQLEEASGESRHRVEITARPEGVHAGARQELVRLVTAGCGRADVHVGELDLPSLPPGPMFPPEVLLSAARSLRDGQVIHRQAGGVHAAALHANDGRQLVLAEDIGRHNALDKVVGYCLLRGMPLGASAAISTGRLSFEMAAKAVRTGIPVLVSASAPTTLALEIAERSGLTLVGYARGGHMTVYTHPERITGWTVD
jgi:FdhD protein